MIVIDDKLISDDVVSEQFVCNLNSCKGACCWEGDFGAPLEEEELSILETIYDKIEDLLTDEGKEAIQKHGKYQWFDEMKGNGTTLIANKACAYLTYDALGIGKCGIEKAYELGRIDFKKPISCHLYPIRIERDDRVGTDFVNYDKWSICSAACSFGKELKVPVYQFLKEPLIRKFGEDFYEQLDATAKYMGK
jgi:Protein of unknown function (DUF3109)